MSAFCLLLLLAAQLPRFTDVTEAAGVTWQHTYTGGNDFLYIAAGAAAADVDGDGLTDLYVLGGQNQPNALFRNKGDGTFENIAVAAGVASDGRHDCGAAFADVDGDGRPDLLLGGINASPKLYRNTGTGFEDITAVAGLTLGGSTFSAAFADTDRDGDLDLMLSHWQTGNHNFFFENDGQGHFVNAGDRVGFADSFRPDLSFTPNFADINGDRWPDLLMAADLGHSRVFLNDGQGHFVDVTDGVITDENGMGAAVGDVDGDGVLDWFVSSVGRAVAAKRGVTGNRLYRGLGNGRFEDITDAAGVREGFWGWGSAFLDVDNDGDLDLFHTNGFLGPFAPGYDGDPSRMFLNDGQGRFTEHASEMGLADTLQGRGVVCFDYDDDGDLDLYLAANGAPGRLLRNDGPVGRFLRVRLRGHDRNTAAVGARLFLETSGRTQMRELRLGNNFVSQNPPEVHFGMGDATQGVLTVHWPDGRVDNYPDLPADQTLTLAHPGAATSCDGEEMRRLVHITAPDGDFQTTVTVRHIGTTPALVDLSAFGADGTVLDTVTLTAAPGGMGRFPARTLWGDAAVAHVVVRAPAGVAVGSAYGLVAGLSAEAQAESVRTSATRFQVYPGNWDVVFDGMALVNPGPAPLTVTAYLRDADGAVIDSAVLATDLAPGARLLTAFNQVFAQPGSLIDVTSDQPAHAVFLRGTHGGTQPGLLYQVAPLSFNP